MEQTYQTLDSNLVEQQELNPELNLASKGKRFANTIIDTICYYLIVFVLALIVGIMGGANSLENKGVLYLFVFLVLLLYYTVFEAAFGKTIGKMITKTKVVDRSGGKITFGQALGRSFSRLIPFEAFTFLGSPGRGLHDRLAETMVINDRG